MSRPTITTTTTRKTNNKMRVDNSRLTELSRLTVVLTALLQFVSHANGLQTVSESAGECIENNYLKYKKAIKFKVTFFLT